VPMGGGKGNGKRGTFVEGYIKGRGKGRSTFVKGRDSVGGLGRGTVTPMKSGA